MAKIIQLNENLSNLIAAGEVIERAASVIKELVENSIDALSTKIKIEVNDLGFSMISVSDNGIGIDKDDLNLAFSRHATSKIKDQNDLIRINTLGFRGEAIPAIASVSKMTIKSRTVNNDGYQITYHGGKFISFGLVAMDLGTTVEVKDLFYNTPARFKYLKSEFSERNSILDLFDHLALSYPNISFSLVIDSKVHKSTSGLGDYNSLISAIFGISLTKDLVVFKENYQKIAIKGFLVSPQFSRTRKKDINIFINGRYITNYTLVNAVVEGFHGFLMNNRYPVAIIYITIDPTLIDVNIHPKKEIIKLTNEILLAYQLTNFIKKALDGTKRNLISSIDFSQNREFVYETVANEHLVLNEMSFSDQDKYASDFFVATNSNKLPDLEYIGTFTGTYLLFQNNESLYLIDQHAAAERIRYESILEKLANPKAVTKKLLFPIDIKLTKNDQLALINILLPLETLGIHFNSELLLSELPLWISDKEQDIVIEEIIATLNERGAVDIAKIKDNLAKSLSCKGSIKANHQLSRIEIEALIKNLANVKNPYNCPHGRPTIIKFSHQDIEKMFKRIL